MKRLVLAFLMGGSLAADASAQTLPEWSIWKNQRTSVLVVSKVDVAAGTFIGTFINNAPGYRCQGFAVPISGTISAADIVFVANFAPCDNTITIWKGTINGKSMPTSFDLRYVDKDTFKEIKDQDVFTQVN